MKKYIPHFFYTVAMAMLLSGCAGIQFRAYSISNVYITDQLDSENQPIQLDGELEPFEATGTIYGVIETRGTDGLVAVRWRIDGQVFHEQIIRTENNHVIAWMKGSERQPIRGGNYLFEAVIPPDTVKASIPFSIIPYVPEVEPPQPTPEGHTDLEHSSYLEVPFAFDEIWKTDGRRYIVNEVKVVFLSDTVLMAVVVDIPYDPETVTAERIDEIARPVARYAIAHGYLERGQNLRINGDQYPLDENITVTLYNKSLNKGYRQQYDLKELLEQDELSH